MGLTKKALRDVRAAVDREIAEQAAQGPIAAGLAAEGYAGGYRDAIDDVLLAMNCSYPDSRYWRLPTPGGGAAEK